MISKDIASLRIVVALLGEKHNWWPTNFYDESSLGFLEYAFPRSKNVALIASNDAIRTIMDEKVGANHFHLFRLQIVLEEQIHQFLGKDVNKEQSEEQALTALRQLAKELPVDGQSGPKNIGSVEQLDSDTIQAFAAEYLQAFTKGYQVHPYLN